MHGWRHVVILTKITDSITPKAARTYHLYYNRMLFSSYV